MYIPRPPPRNNHLLIFFLSLVSTPFVVYCCLSRLQSACNMPGLFVPALSVPRPGHVERRPACPQSRKLHQRQVAGGTASLQEVIVSGEYLSVGRGPREGLARVERVTIYRVASGVGVRGARGGGGGGRPAGGLAQTELSLNINSYPLSQPYSQQHPHTSDLDLEPASTRSTDCALSGSVELWCHLRA